MNLLARFGETVTLEHVDGTTEDVRHVLCSEADLSDQSVMDVQARFINQARYKGDSLTLNVWWPKDAPHDLMGAHVIVRGERYRVYSAPFSMANSPNGYDVRFTCMRSLFLYEATLYRSTVTVDEWGVPHPTYEPTRAMVNLLRLSETAEDLAGRDALARVVLLELQRGTWDDERPFVAFDFAGRRHRITSVDKAEEQVVIGGQEEVRDG